MMALMSVTHSYCQYPKTKVINGDTVVVLLKKQANDINTQFVDYQNAIISKQSSFDSLLKVNDSLFIKLSEKVNVDTLVKQINYLNEVNEKVIDNLVEQKNVINFLGTCTRREAKTYFMLINSGKLKQEENEFVK